MLLESRVPPSGIDFQVRHCSAVNRPFRHASEAAVAAPVSRYCEQIHQAEHIASQRLARMAALPGRRSVTRSRTCEARYESKTERQTFGRMQN